MLVVEVVDVILSVVDVVVVDVVEVVVVHSTINADIIINSRFLSITPFPGALVEHLIVTA